MPHVTVEQVIRFREAALRVEQQRDELLAAIKRLDDETTGLYSTFGSRLNMRRKVWRLDDCRSSNK